MNETPSQLAADASLQSLRIDEATPIHVGPGCIRRDLPSTRDLRVWVVDMEPNAEWPVVDEHPTGEEYLVLSGEVIEGGQRFGPGTYVFFRPGSRHRPRTERGVRLIGVNVAR